MTRNNSRSQKKHKAESQFCAYCGQAFDSHKKQRTFDHFYPLCLGQNLNRSWNKFVVCQPCNWDKKDKMPQEFILWLLHRIEHMDKQSKYFIRASRTITNILLLTRQVEPWFEARDLL